MTARAIALAVALMIGGCHPVMAAPLRLHCADAAGFTLADWTIKDGRYRVKINGEWSSVPADAVGAMLVMLQFTGAPCVRRRP